MANKSKVQKTVLYLDGVKVPFQTISISENYQSASSAAITLPSDPIIHDLPPRSLVHVFYREDNAQSDGETQGDYRLLFEGQVVGTGFNRSHKSRSVNLKVQGMANTLRTFIGDNVETAQPFEHMSRATKGSLFSGAQGPGGLMAPGKQSKIDLHLASKWARSMDKETMVEGVKSLFELLTERDTYFKSIFNRLKITERIPDIDKSLLPKREDLMTKEYWEKRVEKQLGLVRKNKPLLNFIQVILSQLLHEMLFNSSLISGWFPRPQMRLAIPPGCNTLMPKHVSNIGFNTNYLNENTRHILIKRGLQNFQRYSQWPRDYDVEGHAGLSLGASGKIARAIKNDNSLALKTYLKNMEGLMSQNVSLEKEDVNAQLGLSQQGKKKNNSFDISKSQHEFRINRFNSSTMRITGDFNPEPAVGFNIFVVDPSVDVFYGFLASKTHTIDNNRGTVSTEYSVQLGQRMLANPRNQPEPQMNPLFSSGAEKPGELENLYNQFLNSNISERSSSEFDVELPPVDQGVVQQFGSEYGQKRANNAVVSRAITLMNRHVSEQEISESMFKRGHPTPHNVFLDFYEAKVTGEELPERYGPSLADMNIQANSDQPEQEGLPIFLQAEETRLRSILYRRRKVIEVYKKRAESRTSRAEKNAWPEGLVGDYSPKVKKTLAENEDQERERQNQTQNRNESDKIKKQGEAADVKGEDGTGVEAEVEFKTPSEYKVGEGETINSIASRFREHNEPVESEAIISANPDVNPRSLGIGEKLTIPEPEKWGPDNSGTVGLSEVKLVKITNEETCPKFLWNYKQLVKSGEFERAQELRINLTQDRSLCDSIDGYQNVSIKSSWERVDRPNQATIVME